MADRQQDDICIIEQGVSLFTEIEHFRVAKLPPFLDAELAGEIGSAYICNLHDGRKSKIEGQNKEII
ncbi:MAG: hypothetical protein CMN78_03390 [Spirochaetales bacterium]|nr:hypothetical protein [Spirochaetales bacterium]